jgi:hypothetical protein
VARLFRRRGDFPNPSGVSADPSLVRRADDRAFYFFGFYGQASGIWRSDDDCQSFQLLTDGAPSGDRPIMAVDNNPAGPLPAASSQSRRQVLGFLARRTGVRLRINLHLP